MKQTFLITTSKLKELTWLKMSDRDRGQLDHYEGKPSVIFPCALIKINMPKRKNWSQQTQLRNLSIQIRVAFERLYDASTLNSSETNRLKALDYYDKIEEVDELFQGFRDSYFNGAWECTATFDEERPDYDIIRFTFSTSVVK